MIILLFNYIFQYLFASFEAQINDLYDLIESKNNTISKLNNNIRSLKSQIKQLKNSSAPVKDTSSSPKYAPFEVDIPPLSTQLAKPSLDFNQLIQGKTFKLSKCVINNSLPNPEQLCPNCISIIPDTLKIRKSVNAVLLILISKNINLITIMLFIVLIVLKLFLSELKEFLLMSLSAKTNFVLTVLIKLNLLFIIEIKFPIPTDILIYKFMMSLISSITPKFLLLFLLISENLTWISSLKPLLLKLILNFLIEILLLL